MASISYIVLMYVSRVTKRHQMDENRWSLLVIRWSGRYELRNEIEKI
jgi:hypothetical protein